VLTDRHVINTSRLSRIGGPSRPRVARRLHIEAYAPWLGLLIRVGRTSPVEHRCMFMVGSAPFRQQPLTQIHHRGLIGQGLRSAGRLRHSLGAGASCGLRSGALLTPRTVPGGMTVVVGGGLGSGRLTWPARAAGGMVSSQPAAPAISRTIRQGAPR